MSTLSARDRIALRIQREVGRLFGPIWIPLIAGALRFGLGYRIRGMRELRQRFRALRRESDQPLLLCANHLTMIDSAIIAASLAPSWWYIFHFSALAWNIPERRNFASTWVNNALVYLIKCIPIVRGGSRKDIAHVLDSLTYLMSLGEVSLIFPEGGRTRTGRVEIGSAAYGVGRIVKTLPGCRVLCVYLRGDHQEKYSDLPVRGEHFHMDFTCIEPTSEMKGMRETRDLSLQIMNEIVALEERYLDARK